jgi:hypothetical protein
MKRKRGKPATPHSALRTPHLRSGRQIRAVRWTLEQASAEFGIARNTLSKRIKSEGLQPGPDQKFSTADICRAVFTDGEKARAALAISQKENWDLRNAKLSGELADVALFQKESDAMILLLRQKISESQMPEAIKQDVLREIQRIDVKAILADAPAEDNHEEHGDHEGEK